MEFRATAQDGSGSATVLIGTGDPLKAPIPLKPDLMEQMKSMAESHGSHGHGKIPSHSKHTFQESSKGNKSMEHQNSPHQERNPKSDGSAHHQHPINQKDLNTNRLKHHQKKNHKSNGMAHHQNPTHHKSHNTTQPAHHNPINQEEKKAERKIHHKLKGNQISALGYDDLRAVNKTRFSKSLPARTIHLNLTGNMRRYVWSINGKVLSESDKN